MSGNHVLLAALILSTIIATLPNVTVAQPSPPINAVVFAEPWSLDLNESVSYAFPLGYNVFVYSGGALLVLNASDGSVTAVYRNASRPISLIYRDPYTGNYTYAGIRNSTLVVSIIGPSGYREIVVGEDYISSGSMAIRRDYYEIPVYTYRSMLLARIYRNGSVDESESSQYIYMTSPVPGDVDGDGLLDYSRGEAAATYEAAGAAPSVSIYYRGDRGLVARDLGGQVYVYLAMIIHSPSRDRDYLAVYGMETGQGYVNNTIRIYDIANNAYVDSASTSFTSFHTLLYHDDRFIRVAGSGNGSTVYVRSLGSGEWIPVYSSSTGEVSVIGGPDVDGDGGLDAFIVDNDTLYILLHNNTIIGGYVHGLNSPILAGPARVNATDTVLILYSGSRIKAVSARIPGSPGGGEAGEQPHEEPLIDETPPRITGFDIEVYDGAALFTWSVMDNETGVAETILYIDGRAYNVTGETLYRVTGLEPGRHVARLVVRDGAGNEASLDR